MSDWNHKREYHITLKAEVLRGNVWLTPYKANELREDDTVCWVAILQEHYIVAQSFESAERAIYELGLIVECRRLLSAEFKQGGPFENVGPAPS